MATQLRAVKIKESAGKCESEKELWIVVRAMYGGNRKFEGVRKGL